LTSRGRRRCILGLLAVTATAPLLNGCAPAAAQRGGMPPDFADLAERVLPSVVSIAVTSEQRSEAVPPELRGTPFERYYRDRQRRGRQEVMGAGSGFVVDPAGFVVTNTHVIGNASKVVVQMQDGTEYPARVIGMDELTDLALLRIEPRAPLVAVTRGGRGRESLRPRRLDHRRHRLGPRARDRGRALR
jgi:serine protease Do